MAWVESVSPSFRARHESEDRDEVERVIEDLERLRDRLGEALPRTPGDVEIIFHGTPVALDVAAPLLPLAPPPPPAARRPPPPPPPPLPGRREPGRPHRRPRPPGPAPAGLRGARLAAAARPPPLRALRPARGAPAQTEPQSPLPRAAMGLAARGRGGVAGGPGAPRPPGHRPSAARRPTAR